MVCISRGGVVVRYACVSALEALVVDPRSVTIHLCCSTLSRFFDSEIGTDRLNWIIPPRVKMNKNFFF